MPLPQSRIGKVVLLGIVLGILAVFAAAAFATVAHAQELPASVRGAAPYPDNAVCKGWQMFESFALERRIEDAGLNENLTLVRGRLRNLCHQSPGRDDIGSGSGVGWITMVDHVFETLTMSLYDRMNRPVSAKERVVLRDLLHTTALFQRDFELMRIDAYQAVLVETKEVVRTVQIPAQCPRCPDLVCPEAPACPQGPDPFEVADQRRRERELECERVLKSAVRDWHNQLNTNYPWAEKDYGSALYAAGDINSQIGKCHYSGCRDLRSSVVGWERALSGIIEASGRGLGGMSPQVLQRVISLRSMMAAKLEGCRGGEGHR